jgi:NADPH:quinone reductase-like Zn-dependent oxidoreductase
VKAAIVVESGRTPVYRDFEEPVPAAGEARIEVRAAALYNLVKSRATGTHYSSSVQFPFVAGVDGVGRRDDGRRVYFVFPRAPFGSMAEKSVVTTSQLVSLPDDLDDVTAAAIANPGMSSWVALKERAKLVAGEAVLVNGATGTAGRLAVQIAKHLGARRVVATGRNAEALKSLYSLGADETILIGDGGDTFEQTVTEQFRRDGVDVVLDYLWGPIAERIIVAAAKSDKDELPTRFVHIGAVSATNITLPGPALRASAISVMGSGIGSASRDGLMAAFDGLMHAAVPARFQIETRTFPLAEVEHVWATAPNRPRAVFQIP